MSTYSDYLPLRKGPPPPQDTHSAGVRVYADEDGTLHTLQSDGTDAEVGSGGATSGLDTVIVVDSTGYTFAGNPGGARDPMPRTSYTVVRDDLVAVSDPTDGVYLPAGIYLGGGYIDWVPDGGFPSPSGAIAAWIDAASAGLIPEGDEGLVDLSTDISEVENIIVAPTLCFQVPDAAFYHMKCRFNSTDSFTVVRWAFWAARLVDLSI